MGMGPPAIISSPALVSALLAFTCAQVAKVFTHWCAARPPITPRDRVVKLPKIPPNSFLPTRADIPRPDHARSVPQAHDG